MGVSVGSLGIPLAAELTVANTSDADVAPLLLEQMPKQVRYVLGDTHYNDPEFRGACQRQGCELVATRRGAYPHQEGGAQVRAIFHKRRSQSSEPFNGLFKNVFEWRVKMPVKGLQKTRLLALGAIFLSQLALLYQYEQGKTVGKGIKALLRAA